MPVGNTGSSKPYTERAIRRKKVDQIRACKQGLLVTTLVAAVAAYLTIRHSMRDGWWVVAGSLGLAAVNITAFRAAKRALERLDSAATPASEPSAGLSSGAPKAEGDVLGQLAHSAEHDGWIATVDWGGRSVLIVVDGEDQASPAALARAQETLKRQPDFERVLVSHLEREAARPENHSMREEIRGLTVRELAFFSDANQPDRVSIWFEGPTDQRHWHMDLVGDHVTHFGFMH